ncbi:MAG: ABC transporter permease [Mycobacteriales bacterium]
MLLRVLTRAGTLVVSLVVASVVVFAFMAVLPGDPARVALGVNATEQAVGILRHQFGTDRSLPAQYASWIGGLLRGDLGTSYVSRAAIGPQVSDRFGVTAWLVLAGMVVAVVLALPAGLLSAALHRRASGLALSAVTQIGVAVPAFLAGILLIAVFAVKLGWLPANGWIPPDQNPADFLRHMVLPAFALGVVQAAVLTRYVRSAVLEVMRQDYIRTARAKGMTPYRALVRHGLRNAAIPVVTVLGLQLATLLIGAVVIERVFVIPGLGSLLLDAVANRDLLTVQDVVMLLVLAVLIVNAIVDLLYTVLDPRLRDSR